jgi:hypothetical protein
MELEEVQKKAKAKLNESDVGDVDWMANCFRMIMDAFDRDGLLLHEVSVCVCVRERERDREREREKERSVMR